MESATEKQSARKYFGRKLFGLLRVECGKNFEVSKKQLAPLKIIGILKA
jgi:hypothetical protein